MANYRPVSTKTAKDKVFQKHTRDQKLIHYYMITDVATTESGIYELTLKTIKDDLSIPFGPAKKALGNMKNIVYDFDNECIFVINFLKHNGRGRQALIRQAIVNNYKVTSKSLKLWQLFAEIYPLWSDDFLNINNVKVRGIKSRLLDAPPISISTSISNETLPANDLKEDSKPKDIELPDWLPEKLWQSFVDYRKEIKKPMSQKAMTNAIAKLGRFKEAGQDVKAVIEQTTSSTNDWIDLYEVKNNGKGTKDNIGFCPKCKRDHIDLTDEGICYECSNSEIDPIIAGLANGFKGID